MIGRVINYVSGLLFRLRYPNPFFRQRELVVRELRAMGATNIDVPPYGAFLVDILCSLGEQKIAVVSRISPISPHLLADIEDLARRPAMTWLHGRKILVAVDATPGQSFIEEATRRGMHVLSTAGDLQEQFKACAEALGSSAG